MKRNWLIVIAFCLMSFFSEGQDSFFNVYDDWNVWQGDAVIPTESGYYVYAKYGIIAKFNKVGEKLWTKQITTTGPYTTFAERDASGNLFFTSNNDSAKIFKTDSLGTIISTTNLGYGNVHKMIQLNNGNFIILKKSNKNLALHAIDTELVEQWHRILPAPEGDTAFYAIDLTEMPDVTICVMTHTWISGYFQYYLNTFTQSGDFINKKVIEGIESNFFVIRSIIPVNNQEIIYTGEKDSNHWRQYEIGRIGINTGIVSWRKPIFDDVFYAKMMFAGIKEDTVYISGTIQITPFYQKQVLTAAINEQADVIWMNHQGLREKYEVMNARLCPDGGLAVTGSCNTSKCFLMKTNKTGISEILFIPDKIDAQVINICPNPATNFTYITCSTKITQADLFTLQGKFLFSYIPASNQENRFEIPLSTLSKGIYLIRITDINLSSITLKLVK